MKKQIPLIAVGILSLFLSILLLPSKAEAQTYSEYYGLRVSSKSYLHWYYIPAVPLKLDTIAPVGKPSHLRITPIKEFMPGLPIVFRSNQYLLLPEADAREAVVNIHYRATVDTIPSDTITLKAVALDGAMQPMNKQSVRLPVSQTSGTLTLPIEGAKMLELALTVQMTNVGDSARFDLHNISLALDGKDIDTFPLNLGAAPKIDRSQVQDGKVPLPDKPLIAIGENMHGTTTLKHTGVEFIKDRILHHNCRLVMFETTPEAMAIVNYFLEHEEWSDHPDVKDYREALGDEWCNFLQWVQEYNRTAQRKVVVAGMDNHDHLKEGLRYFLYLLSEKTGDAALRDAASTAQPEDLAEALSDSIGVWKHFTADEKYVLYRSVLQQQEVNRRHGKRVRREWLRDSLMCENVDAYYRHFCREGETAVIYSHYGHANKTTRQYGPSELRPMGQRLAERYKDDYYCLALWGGEGVRSHAQLGKTHTTTMQLSDFPAETLERCIDNGSDLRWVPTSAFPDQLVLGNNSGSATKGYDFSFWNIRQGCDAVQFVRRVEARATYPDSNEVWNKRMKKWFELIKERVAQEKKEE